MLSLLKAGWPYLVAFALGMGAGMVVDTKLERRRARGGQIDLSGTGIYRELEMVKAVREEETK